MKQRKFKFWLASICTAFCMCIMPNLNVLANAPQYEIVFKAGLHGTINNDKSVSYPVVAGDIFPNEPTVTPEAGYVFKGWNKELPQVGSRVEGKQTYVAQYDVLVDGVNYIVRYVNQDNVEIATPKSSMAEAGSTIMERAKVVAGYTYQVAQQEFVVDQNKTSFTFVYTLSNPDEVIRYEQEVINQETPAQGNVQDNANNANNENVNDENVDNEIVEEPDTPLANDTPQDNEVVEDNETPLAKGITQDNMNVVIIGGCAVVLAAILVGLYYRKKKHQAAK